MLNMIQKTKQAIKFTGLFFGSLIVGLPTNLTASAIPPTPNTEVNPCPSIYYEEPYNKKLIVPYNCPPNVATTRWIEQGYAPTPQRLAIPSVTSVIPVQPPVPEYRSNAIATVEPILGTVDVKLKNDTNTPISYQAIEHTQTRYLSAGEEVLLQDIPTPATITMVREDGGLLKVTPASNSDKDRLTISLDESVKFDDNQGVLRIQKDGQVFLN
ncbi:MAG: hypothetical protein QNJ47_16700 [Nostocaceae cyanobacterium]|nr:hypothetical protein [Nostocaceae cyanobacterium]